MKAMGAFTENSIWCNYVGVKDFDRSLYQDKLGTKGFDRSLYQDKLGTKVLRNTKHQVGMKVVIRIQC
jgi:hypothetical protein